MVVRHKRRGVKARKEAQTMNQWPGNIINIQRIHPTLILCVCVGGAQMYYIYFFTLRKSYSSIKGYGGSMLRAASLTRRTFIFVCLDDGGGDWG